MVKHILFQSPSELTKRDVAVMLFTWKRLSQVFRALLLKRWHLERPDIPPEHSLLILVVLCVRARVCACVRVSVFKLIIYPSISFNYTPLLQSALAVLVLKVYEFITCNSLQLCIWIWHIYTRLHTYRTLMEFITSVEGVHRPPVGTIPPDYSYSTTRVSTL
jgi:hypothetical protein